MSLKRDDLRTRSEAASAGFRKGGRGGTAGELCEDGADDHLIPTGKLGVCAGKQGGHSLPAAQPHHDSLIGLNGDRAPLES